MSGNRAEPLASALRFTEDLLRSIVESAPNPIAISDLKGSILLINKMGPGLSRSDVIGKPAWQHLIPADAKRAKACFEAVVATGRPGVYEATGNSGMRWIVHVGPRREEGKIVGATFVAWDITKQRELESRLAIADRMVSIGTLAAGVAHEVNNPLTYVLANLEWLDRQAVETGDEAARERLSAALEGVRRIRAVVSDLTAFADVRESKRTVLDVRQVIDSALRMTLGEVRCRARVAKRYGDVPPVLGSEGRLCQVFLNLIVNASQAIAEGSVESNEIAIETRTDPQGRAVVEITDTGGGISGELIDKIFDPFVTTKLRGSGTGLGLYICRNVVAAHGGEIEVKSSPGKRTSFSVILPAAGVQPLEPVAAVADAPPSTRAHRKRRVLVVDDELAIGEAIRDYLGEHEVSVVCSGRRAAQLMAQSDFDVVFCDLLMPDLTGMDLHARLRSTQPEAADKLVFMTGGAFTERARSFLRSVQNRVLQKPFELDQLRDVMARLD